MIKEPYRLLFPIGVFFLLWGALVWLPQIWAPGDYPVLAHRYLMLNGFVASFMCGFLMTAVPKFSGTETAKIQEVIGFVMITLLGVIFAYAGWEHSALLISSGQALLIVYFMFSRLSRRKLNPPYSFIFIFAGLFLWLVSGVSGALFDLEAVKRLHYEGALGCIILGVGSRLIPGILGHVEIVTEQRKVYERPLSLLATVPLSFLGLIIFFVGSYFLSEFAGSFIRSGVVTYIGFRYWLLWKFPRERTSLTWSIWFSSWLILLSFLLRAAWEEGVIHAGHSFFINGVVLLSLLVATRVIQSHGPKDKSLENSMVLYGISFLLLLAGTTRVCAFLMPEKYLTHLGYSAIVLVIAVLVWSVKYLRFIRTY